MAKPLLDDVLWNQIQVLIPAPKPRRSRYPGRKPIDDRKALTGILFVLKMGIPWEDLPQEMGCGSGMTCWRRLQLWHQAGAWQYIQQQLMVQWRGAEHVDWSRAAHDSAPMPQYEEMQIAPSGTYQGYTSPLAAPIRQEAGHLLSSGPDYLAEPRFGGQLATVGGFQEAHLA